MVCLLFKVVVDMVFKAVGYFFSIYLILLGKIVFLIKGIFVNLFYLSDVFFRVIYYFVNLKVFYGKKKFFMLNRV